MIVIHPSPARDYDKRRWDKFPELADRLIYKYGNVSFTGTEDQRDYVYGIRKKMKNVGKTIDRCGLDSIASLAKLIRDADLLITVNTLTMHLGVTLKVPTVAIIGGTAASVVAPLDSELFKYVENVDRINDITVDDVMEKVNEIPGF